MTNIDIYFPATLPKYIMFLQTWQVIALAITILLGGIIFWLVFKNKSEWDGYYLISQNEWGDNFRLHPIIGPISMVIGLLYILVYILIFPELSIISINNILLSELYPSIGMILFPLITVMNVTFGSLGLGL